MDARKQKIIEALAERMGWRYYPKEKGAMNGPHWLSPSGHVVAVYDDWPHPFNPYESEADCAALVDWMAGQDWWLCLNLFPGNCYARFRKSPIIDLDRPAHRKNFTTIINRKTAITECAAEALGVSEHE